ncbi:MAG: exopolyphosphatase [Deltaproteobacteria bacterium]|nr:exopolyphosphatase [Deltaproteobacteria bacterium]
MSQQSPSRLRFLERSADDEPEILAAVDLGSNSFHMIVARLSHGQPTVIDRLREMVRLAAGLDENHSLSAESQQVALDCLARFGERIRAMHADRVRVVGTSTLRSVGRHSDFVEKAEEALGQPVEIIAGVEEARLIYQGVYHSSPGVDGSQIVVDIGGGSTEIIRGSGSEAEAMESLKLGCVGISERFFPGGKLTAQRFARARLATRLEIEPVRTRFLAGAPQRLIGASGTIRAAQAVLAAIEAESSDITVKGLEDLIGCAIDAGQISRLKLPGLSSQRRPVFSGGLAILIEVMSALQFDRMSVSDGALREGLLYDMVGRLTDEDARDRTVRAMEGRFNIDRDQAARVESTAMRLLDQVAESWKLDQPLDRQVLRWAARLHEMGLDIAHADYNRHGAYLLEYSDMPGFPTGEQQVLAWIVGGHRGKFNRGSFHGEMPRTWSRRSKRLTVVLRLAVLLNRSRTSATVDDVMLSAKGRKLTVAIPQTGPETGPLTWADLEREVEFLADVNLKMTLEKVGEA